METTLDCPMVVNMRVKYELYWKRKLLRTIMGNTRLNVEIKITKYRGVIVAVPLSREGGMQKSLVACKFQYEYMSSQMDSIRVRFDITDW